MNNKPYSILDATLFYEGYEVHTLMRQLYRMNYEEKEAKKIFKKWLKKRGYKIVDVPTVETEME